MTRRIAFLCGIWAFTFAAHAADGWRARVGHTLQNADTYDGNTTSLGVSYRAPGGFDLGAGFDHLNRTYAGTTRVKDATYSLSSAVPLNAHAYVESSAQAGETANIYARWSAFVAPHVVFNRNDLGLGVRYAEYKNGRAGGLNPSYLHYFKNGLALGTGAYVVRTETWITAFSAQALFAPGERHSWRLTGAAGRTLEDAGVQARFNSISAEYTYTCRAGFTVGLQSTDYWSEVRRERVLGFKLGWR